MLSKLRSHLTYANVVSSLCLFISMTGVAYAADVLPRNSVGSKQIKSNAVGNSELKDEAVGTDEVEDGQLESTDIKNGSLRAGDFKAGQLPAGARGAQGTQGPQGVQGPVGTAGATNVQSVLREGNGSCAGSSPGCAVSVDVDCPAGTRATGGGGFGGSGDAVQKSIPKGSAAAPSGWQVTIVAAADAFAGSPTVYALCAAP